MNFLSSKFRILWDDVLATIRSLAKIRSIIHIPLYTNAIYLILSNVSTGIFGFVFWIIAARLYTTEVIGETSGIIAAATMLEMLCFMGFDYGLIRFLKSSNNPVKLINSSFTMIGLFSLAIAGIFIWGLGIWSPGLSIIRENHYYLVIFLLYVPILVLDDLTDQIMIAGRQSKFILMHLLIFNILRLSLLVALVFLLKSFGIFVSWSAATFVALLFSIFFLLPRTQPGYHIFFLIDRKEVSNVLHFSFLNFLSDLFWNMPGLVLPLLVLNIIGSKSNAYFYMAWTLSTILTMIPGALARNLLAEGAYDEAKIKYHIHRSLKMIMVLLIPAIAIVWFLSDKLLLLYGGIYSENATTLLRWLALASFPFAINVIYFSIKRLQKHLKPVIILASFMAFIVLLLSYLLLPRLGINGVGIAWLAGQSIIALIATTWDRRIWI
jgi:O-antigen/teichoic acid export membrane protein